MKTLPFILFSLLIATLYFFSIYIDSPSAPPLSVIAGRRPPRRLMSSPDQRDRNPKVKDMMAGSKQSGIQNSVALQYSRSRDDLDELVYHIDYHGVTTHPTPIPRHPKP